MNRIRLGIIGLGNVYEYQKQALTSENNLKVTALCDIDEGKACREAGFFGAAHYKDNHRLLNSPDVDAVLVSTPAGTHYELGLEVLRARKHLLAEKPATLDVRELKELRATAVENGVMLVVAFHAAFAKDLLWFMDEYRSGLKDILGPVTGIDCEFYDPYIKDGVLDKKAVSLAGSWIDSGINALSVVVRLLGPAELRLREKLLIESEAYPVPSISGTAVYATDAEQDTKQGQGCTVTIKTDWTLEKNLKMSTLYFEHTKNKIILHHTGQKVIMTDSRDRTVTLKDFSDGDNRLVAHYKGVFADFAKRVFDGPDNYEFELKTHTLLLEEVNRNDG